MAASPDPHDLPLPRDPRDRLPPFLARLCPAPETVKQQSRLWAGKVLSFLYRSAVRLGKACSRGWSALARRVRKKRASRPDGFSLLPPPAACEPPPLPATFGPPLIALPRPTGCNSPAIPLPPLSDLAAAKHPSRPSAAKVHGWPTRFEETIVPGTSSPSDAAPPRCERSFPGEALMMKQFDLNIDKILDGWDLSDAIRELIANAIDESILTQTQFPEVCKDDSGCWHIRDFGRGLRYQDLIQSENPEKLENPSMIGKFGIGLKDALATFERRGVKVLIKSRHGDITLSRVSKHSFEDLITLHATVLPPSSPDLQGTDCCLSVVADSHVSATKQMFLRFTGSSAIEETSFGAVHSRTTTGGAIYVNGMKVAEEPDFLFSYNITALNSAIKRALNRERRNVGRTAYAERVRSILLSCESRQVAESLTNDLQAQSAGSSHDELNWLDVQEHAVRILSAQKKVVFLNPAQLAARPEIVDTAKSTGFQVVAVPERLTKKIEGINDLSGKPVIELREFAKQQDASIQHSWIAPKDLTSAEHATWSQADRILQLIGGRPYNVRDIRISETICSGLLSSGRETGLWVGSDGRIIVKRTELRSLATFAGVLLHEAIHAKTAVTDVSREFETNLTNLVGELAAKVLSEPRAGDFPSPKPTLLRGDP